MAQHQSGHPIIVPQFDERVLRCFTESTVVLKATGIKDVVRLEISHVVQRVKRRESEVLDGTPCHFRKTAVELFERMTSGASAALQ